MKASATLSRTSELVPDDPAVLRLLAASGLPSSDLDAPPEKLLFGIYEDSELIAVGGIELCGECGLLRSVVVATEHRGTGKGKVVCQLLIEEAGRRGIRELYLLTNTAVGFFQRFGFEPVERGSVPFAIQQTQEFTNLCPQTAVVMRYTL
jgi:amino-acid N-acetyltransferase